MLNYSKFDKIQICFNATFLDYELFENVILSYFTKLKPHNMNFIKNGENASIAVTNTCMHIVYSK